MKRIKSKLFMPLTLMGVGGMALSIYEMTNSEMMLYTGVFFLALGVYVFGNTILYNK